jgi:hypothetical protein
MKPNDPREKLRAGGNFCFVKFSRSLRVSGKLKRGFNREPSVLYFHTWECSRGLNFYLHVIIYLGVCLFCSYYWFCFEAYVKRGGKLVKTFIGIIKIYLFGHSFTYINMIYSPNRFNSINFTLLFTCSARRRRRQRWRCTKSSKNEPINTYHT